MDRPKLNPFWLGPPLGVLDIEPLLGLEPGRKGVIDVEDCAEIRRLHRAEGLSIKAIMRRTGLARNTVRDALRSEVPPRYERSPVGSAIGPA